MMKKNKLVAATLCCMITAFTACTIDDNPVVPTSGQAMITVNTAALYNELNITDLMPQTLNDGRNTIVDTVLIYNQAGNLLKKLGAETKTLQPLTIEAGDLPNGTYTLLAWQTTRDKDGKIAWFLSDEEQLSTVNLYTIYDVFLYTRALGAASATITIEGGNTEINLSPKPLGSIIELRVDNLTEDKGYTGVTLIGPNSQYVIGCRLDPSLSEEDRWIMEREHDWFETVGKFNAGTDSQKFFTLTHGNKVWFDLYGVKEDGSSEWLLDGGYHLGTGENAIFYFDMNCLRYQPTFFGTYEDFAVWKADRDAGILVVDPCLDWGCSIDDVVQHILTKQWWNFGNDKLELWEGLGWHNWYFIAYLLTEHYLFETEDGQNLKLALSICHDPTVPLDVANNSLLKQGYIYSGKIAFPGQEPYDIFFSPDGQTEIQTMLYNDGRWQISYQPTDSNDFQYIIPAGETAARTTTESNTMPVQRLAPSVPKLMPAERVASKDFGQPRTWVELASVGHGIPEGQPNQ